MKWTLLALLIINLAFGGYQFWLSKQPAESQLAVVSTNFDNLSLTTNQIQRLALSSEKTPALTNKPANNCIRIRGLAEEDGLSVVESRLRALEAKIQRVTEKVVLRQDFQVILGPYASSDLARNEMQSIAAKGVESYVITAGESENALSLGVFSSDLNANRKIDELAALEIDAKIVTKDHFGEAVSLIVDKDSAGLISDSTLESILSSFDKANFLRYQCN